MDIVQVGRNVLIKIGQTASNVASNFLVGVPVILNRASVAAWALKPTEIALVPKAYLGDGNRSKSYKHE
jgi:hypothetical protein